jgi:anthranilate phosphoribosyltransferase
MARMLNPFNAPYMMQGIFHPGYRDIHQEAGQALGQPHMVVIKGEGGEIERNPDLPCLIRSVHGGELSEEEWPPMFSRRHVRKDELEVGHLAEVWNGSREDEYGIASVIGTVAVTLHMMGRTASREQAEQQARAMWDARDKERLNTAA